MKRNGVKGDKYVEKMKKLLDIEKGNAAKGKKSEEKKKDEAAKGKDTPDNKIKEKNQDGKEMVVGKPMRYDLVQ